LFPERTDVVFNRPLNHPPRQQALRSL
jgi:hypothetical protein